MIINSRASTPRDQQDLQEVTSVLLSNEDISGNSKFITIYEQKLCQYFNVKHAIAVSSGTAAIHCALASLNIGAGDEVIVPVTAAVMSAIPIVALGAKIIFVDCKSNSFGICPQSLRNKITKNTKAIISVAMWGYPAYCNKIHEISIEFNIPIIEDAAQAIGTVNQGNFEGTHGLIGCFSTHELKLISTGEGGFILTNNQIIAEACRAYSKIGLGHPSVTEVSYGAMMGLNYKLNALAAALGSSQLLKLNQKLASRKTNATLWKKHLGENSLLETFYHDNDNNKPSYYGAIFLMNKIVYDKKINFANHLSKIGISTDIFRYKYKLLSEYPLFKKYREEPNASKEIEFNNASSLIPRLLVLPTHEHLNSDIIEHGASIIKTAIRDLVA